MWPSAEIVAPIRGDEGEGCDDRVEEITAEASATGFVPANRLAEFLPVH